jgi:hypothetical protein
MTRTFKTAWFHKQALKANIDESELMAFRTLVKAYKGLSSTQVQQLLDEGDFLEICHDA